MERLRQETHCGNPRAATTSGLVACLDGEAVGWCLEAHDLVLAKCAAGRERDWKFVETALEHELVDFEELSRRVVDLPLPSRQIDHVVAMLEARFDRARRGR